MNPFLKFLAAARSLKNQGFKKEQVYEFARREFGEINELMQKQIENIFNPKKTIGSKNKYFDPNDPLPYYNETPGEFVRRETPGSKENLLQELKIAYEKEFNRLRGDETAQELKEILKNLDTDGVPFASGGRAGYYGGGQAMVGEDLSEIGHGSDSLMARNMQLAPNSMATTSTGLNYLLGQDNDTARVPYKDGFSVQPFVSASRSNQGFEDGTNVNLQDLTYGGNVMYDKGLFSVGIEHLKGKDKYDFKYKDDTIVKDTSDRENTNLLFAIDIANTIKGKARLNKEGGQFEISMPFAEGGPARQNFKMGKRAFLQWMASGAAGIAGLKTGLFGLGKKEIAKEIAKDLTSVPIGNPQGMPVWFKPLVNRIIKEGDDVTKKFGTVDRELVHTKRLDKFEEVTVYQDLSTGNVRLEYGPHLTDDTGKVIRASNEPGVIHLEYRAPEIIEPNIKTGKGGGKTKEEFSAAESEPEVVNWEGDIEMSGENVVNTVDDLITDTSKLQKYATDNKLTIKELSDSMKKQKYKNKLDSDPMEQVNYIENKQGMNAMDYIDEGTRVGDFDPKGYLNYDTKGMNLYDGIKKIKKADGGRIGYKLGKKVAPVAKEGIETLIKKVNKLFGKDTLTTADKLPLPQKTLDREMFNSATKRFNNNKSIIPKDEYAEYSKDFDKEILGKYSPENAVDDIFPSGDYKYDADMAAEAYVENNPKMFKNMLYEDLDDRARSEVYSKVLTVISQRNAKMLKMKRNAKSIDISDDAVADDFTNFIKKTDPEGFKELEQKLLLENAKKPKNRKLNSEGGRIGLLVGGGPLKALINNLAKERGFKNGSELLKIMNYKNLPSKVKNLMTKEEFDTMKANRLEGVERWKDLMISQQEMTKNIDAGLNTPAAGLFKELEKTSPGYGIVPRNIRDKDILQMEQMIKNMETKGKGRKLNATGGIATMLGE